MSCPRWHKLKTQIWPSMLYPFSFYSPNRKRWRYGRMCIQTQHSRKKISPWHMFYLALQCHLPPHFSPHPLCSSVTTTLASPGWLKTQVLIGTAHCTSAASIKTIKRLHQSIHSFIYLMASFTPNKLYSESPITGSKKTGARSPDF